jgi:hypothetical protein
MKRKHRVLLERLPCSASQSIKDLMGLRTLPERSILEVAAGIRRIFLERFIYFGSQPLKGPLMDSSMPAHAQDFRDNAVNSLITDLASPFLCESTKATASSILC